MQSAPGTVMDGLRREPSRKTPLSERALYTAARTFSCTSAVLSMLWSPSMRISGSTIGTRPGDAMLNLCVVTSHVDSRQGDFRQKLF